MNINRTNSQQNFTSTLTEQIHNKILPQHLFPMHLKSLLVFI